MCEQLKIGDRVERVRGSYKFPGVVIGINTKLGGATLIDVECIALGCGGVTHIFRPQDLGPMSAATERTLLVAERLRRAEELLREAYEFIQNNARAAPSKWSVVGDIAAFLAANPEGE